MLEAAVAVPDVITTSLTIMAGAAIIDLLLVPLLLKPSIIPLRKWGIHADITAATEQSGWDAYKEVPFSIHTKGRMRWWAV